MKRGIKRRKCKKLRDNNFIKVGKGLREMYGGKERCIQNFGGET